MTVRPENRPWKTAPGDRAESHWERLQPHRLTWEQFLALVMRHGAPDDFRGIGRLNGIRMIRADRWAQVAAAFDGAEGVYFTPHSYSGPRRVAAAFRGSCVLVLDLDAGAAKFDKHGDKVYPTQEAALRALVKFLKELGLEVAILVDSGAGLHAYFLLDRQVGDADWFRLAELLKAACAKFGLLADPTVTADKARVIRFPGSVHTNGHTCNAYRVGGKEYAPDDLESRLRAYVGEAERAAPAEALEPIGAAAEGEGPKADFSQISSPGGCAWAARAAKTGGPGYDDWLNLLALVRHCEGGESLAHEVSKSHPEYDADATAKKFHSLTGGPPTCERIAAPECKECPHRG